MQSLPFRPCLHLPWQGLKNGYCWESLKIMLSELKEQCHDVFKHFSDYFVTEENLKIIVF